MFAACFRSTIEPGEALRLDGPETGGVPIALFLIFETWFLVPLPKGPIEEWFGL